MSRQVPALVLAAAALAACDEPSLRLTPAEIAAFSGVRTVVEVDPALGCGDAGEVSVSLASGDPTAPAFEVLVVEVHEPSRDGMTCFIGNPGEGPPWNVPEMPGAQEPPPLPCDDGGRVVGYHLLVEPGIGTAPGAYGLTVSTRGCGTEVSASLAVEVLGLIDLGGFCGTTSGARCSEDEGCERAGCGELCGAKGTAWTAQVAGEPPERPFPMSFGSAGGLPPRCHDSACSDPVPSGAACGCVQGACAWRLP